MTATLTRDLSGSGHEYLRQYWQLCPDAGQDTRRGHRAFRRRGRADDCRIESSRRHCPRRPGPLDLTANKDDSIVLNIGEPLVGEVDPGFNPWIRLYGPDGALLGTQSGQRVAQITETAPLSGTYTVLVTSSFANAADGLYLLTLVKAPGLFPFPMAIRAGR